MPTPTSRRRPLRPRNEGIWCLCAEAQADGVPCVEMGRKCETCERAVRERDLPQALGDDPAR